MYVRRFGSRQKITLTEYKKGANNGTVGDAWASFYIRLLLGADARKPSEIQTSGRQQMCQP